MAFIAIVDNQPALRAQFEGYLADEAINPEVFVAGLNDETRQLALRWSISKQARFQGDETPHIVKLTTALLSREDVVIGAEVRELIKLRLLSPWMQMLAMGTPAARACWVRARDAALNALGLAAPAALTYDRSIHFSNSHHRTVLAEATEHLAELGPLERELCGRLRERDLAPGASFIEVLEGMIPGEVTAAVRAKLAAMDVV